MKYESMKKYTHEIMQLIFDIIIFWELLNNLLFWS